MDYEAIARDAGGLPEAIEDITRRLEGKFRGEEPSLAAAKEWITTTLRQAAPHLFAEEQTLWERLNMTEQAFNQMPPSWRLGQAMAQQAQRTPPHPRRPVPKEAPADVQAQWKDLPAAQRLTKYREWRDAQQG